jgi:peptidoglycan/LPS O-acetylase OafA/YrhL
VQFSSAPAGEHGPAPLAPIRRDLPPLTGLRFAAAFSVVVAHGVSTILPIEETPFGPVYWLRQASGFGMTLFFVLSGFVIHYNYRMLATGAGKKGLGTFLWARFARLYPLFILTLLLNIFVSSRFARLLGGDSDSFAGLLSALPYFLVFTQSWFYMPIDGVPLISAIGGGSPMTWSISTEWFFYLAYPSIALLLVRMRTSRRTALTIVVWCGLWITLASILYESSSSLDAWAGARWLLHSPPEQIQNDSFSRWLLYFSPYLRIGEFVLGCLIAELFLQLSSRGAGTAERALGLVLLIMACLSVPVITYLSYEPTAGIAFFRRLNMNFALAPSAALIIFAVVRWHTPVSRLLASRPLVALGEASYSIYLIHYVVFMVIVRTHVGLLTAPAPNVIIEVVRFSMILGAIFGVSLISYALVEAPSRHWLRSLWSGRTRGNRRRLVYVAAVPVVLALIIASIVPALFPARQASAENVAGPYKIGPGTVR